MGAVMIEDPVVEEWGHWEFREASDDELDAMLAEDPVFAEELRREGKLPPGYVSPDDPVVSASAERLRDDWIGSFSSENTRVTYALSIEQWFDFLAERGIDPLKAQRRDGDEFRAELQLRGLADATVELRLNTARSFFEYLVDVEALEVNPLRRVRHRWARGESSQPWLDLRDLRRLLIAAQSTRTPLRDFMLCALLGLNGLRCNEVTTARVEGLDVVGGHRVLRVRRKGAKAGAVPLAEPVAEILDEYLDWRGEPRDSGPLLVALGHRGRTEPKRPLRALDNPNARRRVKAIAKLAGLGSDVSPHALRRSFATLSLAKGVPLHHVQDAMGHSNPATTQIYNRARHNLENNPTHALSADVFEGKPSAPKVERQVTAPSTGNLPDDPKPATNGKHSTVRRVIAVDAAWDSELGVAGIGASVDGTPRGAQIVTVDDGNAAELMAIGYGIELASSLGPERPIIIYSDNESAVKRVRWGKPYGLKVRKRPRSHQNIRIAHAVARAALKGWRAGAAGVATWEAT